MTNLHSLFDIIYLNREQQCKDFIDSIPIHPILKTDYFIRKHFLLCVSYQYFSGEFVFHLFKKLFDVENKICINDNIKYIYSFILDTNEELTYDWRKLEDHDFIVNNNIPESYFYILNDNLFPIKFEDVNFFMELRDNYYLLSEEFKKELEPKYVGKVFNPLEVLWQVILVTKITTFYPVGQEINIRCKNFKSGKLVDIFYPQYNENSIIFRNFISHKLAICDHCEETFNLFENKLWHHPISGDICNCCYSKKLNKENKRKDYFKRYMLSVGKSVIFKRDCQRMKNYLKFNKILPRSYTKKYLFMKTINKNLIINQSLNKKTCSICLDDLGNDISAGACGHCFHTECINKLDSNKCPLCRKTSNFIKLHLD